MIGKSPMGMSEGAASVPLQFAWANCAAKRTRASVREGAASVPLQFARANCAAKRTRASVREGAASVPLQFAWANCAAKRTRASVHATFGSCCLVLRQISFLKRSRLRHGWLPTI